MEARQRTAGNTRGSAGSSTAELDRRASGPAITGASGPAVTGPGGPVVAGTRFLAVTDVTGTSGPAGTGASGPVVTGTRFRTVTNVAEASGPAATRADGPIVTRTRFRAVTDVAGASGPAGTGAGGPVVAGTGFRAVTDAAGASGPAVTGAGGPVVAGTRFLAVAEVYAPFEETEGDLQGDIGEVDQNFNIPEEDAGFRPLEHLGVKKGGRPKNGRTTIDCTAQEVEIVSHPLEHSGVVEGADVSDGLKKRHLPEIYTDPAPVRKASEEEPMEYSAPSGTPNEGSEPLNTDCPGDTEDGEAIIVGAVGSAAPWFLTGWTNDVEVEFMIDTGCQVTILATSVFEKMCTAHPQVKSRIRPCTRRLVSADSSPLTVVGQIDLDVVFPGLKCNMCCVVASIGSDGLLGMEALQSCLPHQLDLRTGQLWAEGRSTLQLHQQKPTPDVRGLLLTAVVLPPDSEVVAPFSLNGGHLGSCALIVPDRTGLACDPEKLSAVRNWHEPNRVKAVRQFVGFVGYYRRFVKNFAELADPLVALTRKGVPFVWGSEQQTAFDALKACLWSAPILGFPTDSPRTPVCLPSEVFLVNFKMKRR